MHIAARVMAAAQPGEILVSRTVRDLAAGADVILEDRGMHLSQGRRRRLAAPRRGAALTATVASAGDPGACAARVSGLAVAYPRLKGWT